MGNGKGQLVSIILPSIIAILVSLNVTNTSADPIQQFGFDQHPYVVSNNGALMHYDPEWVGDGTKNSIQAQIINAPCYDTNIVPFFVQLNETENLDGSWLDDGWVYSQRITFALSSNCGSEQPAPDTSGPFEIKVIGGQTIKANLTQTVVLTDSVNITSADTQPLLWAPKRTDANWATCTDADPDENAQPVGDGICDSFEDDVSPYHLSIDYPVGSSIYNYTGNGPLRNCAFFVPEPCSGSDKRDIWIEFDHMQKFPLNETALKTIRAAFWEHEIRVHFEIDEAIPNKDQLKPGGLNHPRFFGTDQVKAYYFGSPNERNDPDWSELGWKQKKQAFRYALYIDEQKGAPTSSGFAEVLGNDFGISFGGWPSGVPTNKDFQAGTIMHELGHNLNLHHGGPPNDLINCKPNYLSVMSYSRQLPTLISAPPLNDFSNTTMDTLQEDALLEQNGIGGPYSEYTHPISTVFGPEPKMVTLPPGGTGPIDWNQDDVYNSDPVQVHVNYLIDEGCGQQTYDQLDGYDDWASLNLNSKGTANWADGRMEGSCKWKQPGPSNPNVPCVRTGPPQDNQIRFQGPMSENSRSPYWNTDIEWKERVWSAGNSEMTYEVAKGHYLANARALNSIIQKLDDAAFSINADTARTLYNNDFQDIIESIMRDDYTESTSKLEAIRKTIDGIGTDDRIFQDFVISKNIAGALENSINGQESLGTIIHEVMKKIIDVKPVDPSPFIAAIIGLAISVAVATGLYLRLRAKVAP